MCRPARAAAGYPRGRSSTTTSRVADDGSKNAVDDAAVAITAVAAAGVVGEGHRAPTSRRTTSSAEMLNWNSTGCLGALPGCLTRAADTLVSPEVAGGCVRNESPPASTTNRLVDDNKATVRHADITSTARRASEKIKHVRNTTRQERLLKSKNVRRGARSVPVVTSSTAPLEPPSRTGSPSAVIGITRSRSVPAATDSVGPDLALLSGNTGSSADMLRAATKTPLGWPSSLPSITEDKSLAYDAGCCTDVCHRSRLPAGQASPLLMWPRNPDRVEWGEGGLLGRGGMRPTGRGGSGGGGGGNGREKTASFRRGVSDGSVSMLATAAAAVENWIECSPPPHASVSKPTKRNGDTPSNDCPAEVS